VGRTQKRKIIFESIALELENGDPTFSSYSSCPSSPSVETDDKKQFFNDVWNSNDAKTFYRFKKMANSMTCRPFNLTKPVPENFEFGAFDWPENISLILAFLAASGSPRLETRESFKKHWVYCWVFNSIKPCSANKIIMQTKTVKQFEFECWIKQ